MHCETDDLPERRKKAWRSYYMKTVLFNKEYFGHWKKVLFLDARMDIHRPLEQAFFEQIDSTGVIFGNPDAWPNNLDRWTLASQFYRGCNEALYEELVNSVDLGDLDYYQSGVILFDTSILLENTLEELLELYHRFGPLADGDQGIFSMYWKNRRNLYRPLPYRLPGTLETPYDYSSRAKGIRYIVTAHRASKLGSDVV
jgi:hypothetical protein